MEELLKEIENFIRKKKMTATSFGIKVTKNPLFVFNLRKGKGCTMATRDKVLNFINDNSTGPDAA